MIRTRPRLLSDLALAKAFFTYAVFAFARSVNSALGLGFLPILLLLPTVWMVAKVTPPWDQVKFSTNLPKPASPAWLVTGIVLWPMDLPFG